MVRGRGGQSFFVIVVDRDKKEFSVEGPTSDETKWHEARERGEAKGRHIDVSPYQDWDSLDGKLPDIEKIIESQKRADHHLKHVPPGTILGKYMLR
ncbi:hypothetical protein [Rhizobium brockwellii]|uniref:hypothetical protein n=1 Tax=Rhizobium brockwellii TaxID=3019932 RepID=UPI00293DE6D0|nr:hypothetical protein [Rhizobium brockwellii]MDV4159314.1 hypothetical protein [Rhizobium brockwellii]